MLIVVPLLLLIALEEACTLIPYPTPSSLGGIDLSQNVAMVCTSVLLCLLHLIEHVSSIMISCSRHSRESFVSLPQWHLTQYTPLPVGADTTFTQVVVVLESTMPVIVSKCWIRTLKRLVLVSLLKIMATSTCCFIFLIVCNVDPW
jgi:hypothetical protein